jgi:DHA1 family bicyclomycin/chloramphenicol resistance-like MFS transporter
MSGAMTPFPRIAGNAASLVGLCQYGLSAVVGTAVAALFDGTQMPMAGAIGAMAVLSALAYATLVRPART